MHAGMAKRSRKGQSPARGWDGPRRLSGLATVAPADADDSPTRLPSPRMDAANHFALMADSTTFHGAPDKVRVRATITPPTSDQPLREFSFSRSVTGQIVAADHYGAAWGEGATLGEALEAWRHDARDVYGVLLKHQGRVHRRLEPQLAFLRRFFG